MQIAVTKLVEVGTVEVGIRGKQTVTAAILDLIGSDYEASGLGSDGKDAHYEFPGEDGGRRILRIEAPDSPFGENVGGSEFA